MDFTFERLLNILQVTAPQRQVVDRTQIQISGSKQQLEWTNPNVLPNHLVPNFTKSQMVSILLYINGMIVYCFSLALPVGWGLWGRQGQTMQTSKWAKAIWIWLYADSIVCGSVVFNVFQTFCVLASKAGGGGGMTVFL